MNARCVVLLSSIALLCAGCGKEVHLKADAVGDRASVPVLDASDVSTLVSDSGVTRYRITADKWQIYDKANPSYWEFPSGIYLEKFNEALEVEASLKADYARYDDGIQRWKLHGNVSALNEVGERFETTELYWDQPSERIYSDSSIIITRETSIIKGVGFVSNQTMTRYTILKPTGYFPLKDE